MLREWTLKYYAKWKRPDAKDHILCDSVYMECPDKSESRSIVTQGWSDSRDYLQRNTMKLLGVTEMI